MGRKISSGPCFQIPPRLDVPTRTHRKRRQMCSTHSVLGPMRRCIICYEDTHETASLSCASGHAVCNGCFGPYLHERAGALGKTDLLASKAETAELLANAALCRAFESDPTTAALAYATQAEAFQGKCHCPLGGHGCTAPPFTDRQVAAHADDEAFEACARPRLEHSGPLAPPDLARPWADVQAKTLLPAAKRLQAAMQNFPVGRENFPGFETLQAGMVALQAQLTLPLASELRPSSMQAQLEPPTLQPTGQQTMQAGGQHTMPASRMPECWYFSHYGECSNKDCLFSCTLTLTLPLPLPRTCTLTLTLSLTRTASSCTLTLTCTLPLTCTLYKPHPHPKQDCRFLHPNPNVT